jgi:hypothetical protein
MGLERRVGSGRSQIQPVLVERQELVLGEGLSPTSGAGPWKTNENKAQNVRGGSEE